MPTISPSLRPGINPTPGTTAPNPRRNGAPALPHHHPDGSERRVRAISTKAGVSQLLDIYDDIVGASDDLRAYLGQEIARSLGGPSATFCKQLLCHCQELVAISKDLEDVCDELLPGAPQARTYSFVSPLKTFPPVLDAGVDRK